jgi:heterotetrameric sarcosine oxidase gamma subunit
VHDDLVFSISPGEWIVLGKRPQVGDVVDLTHVRAMFRLGGLGARRVLEHVCAIDLSDEMTPNGAAARTLVAGVATEIVRDDVGSEPSYLLLMSRSFGRHVWERLVAVGDRG